MKAIVREHYGGPEVIEIKDIDKPSPKSNEILVKVYATTVNRTDWGVIAGDPFIFRFFIGLFSPKLKVLGTDFAGQVEAVGEEVTMFNVGDRVWGLRDEGLESQAEYMVIKQDAGVLKIHDTLDYHQAVASAEGAHYAFNGIMKLKVKAGDKVLVNGGTGAIGSAAVQMLKYFGCYVTVVANTKNLELMKSLGADKLYNWEKEDFTLLDDEQYNFVFDAVGKSTFGKCKKLMKEGGIYISTELGPRAENVYLPLFTYFSKRKVKFPIPQKIRRSLLFVNRLIKEGKFKAVIDRTYKMEEVKEAYKYMITGHKTGNVILEIAK